MARVVRDKDALESARYRLESGIRLGLRGREHDPVLRSEEGMR